MAKEQRRRGLYDGLGVADSTRTRRPQKRALVEACAPVSRALFDTLVARVEALERQVGHKESGSD
jgi:hypothetical protein